MKSLSTTVLGSEFHTDATEVIKWLIKVQRTNLMPHWGLCEIAVNDFLKFAYKSIFKSYRKFHSLGSLISVNSWKYSVNGLSTLGHTNRIISKLLNIWINQLDSSAKAHKLNKNNNIESEYNGTVRLMLQWLLNLSLIHISEPTRPY